MPIVVRHTPVGLLTRLAVESGQARRQEIQAQRDIQLQQAAWATEERGADVAARRAEQQQAQAFALQRAGAAQIVRERPITPKAELKRNDLFSTVGEMRSSGIYRPEQIKQAEIFASLGDKVGVRSIVGDIPSPTSRQRELTRQTRVVEQRSRGAMEPLQQQLKTIEEQLHAQYTPGTIQLFRERPEYLDTATEGTRELMEQQQQLREQIEQVQQQTTRTKQMLEYGVSVPEQMEAQARQNQQTAKMIIEEHKRQTAAAAGINPRQKLAIDVVRDNRKDERRRINKEITAIDNEMLPFLDEDGEPSESPQEYNERVEPLRLQKQGKLDWYAKSENTEKIEIEAILNPQAVKTAAKRKYEIGKTYRSAAGSRIKYIGKNAQGQNQFQEID